MTVLLHCSTCGGSKKYPGSSMRRCDIDLIRLTPEYRKRIKRYGCSFYTARGIPRKTNTGQFPEIIEFENACAGFRFIFGKGLS
jgi:hypothetical protein